MKSVCFFIVVVRTVLATTFATIASLQMVRFRKHTVSLRIPIKIFFLKWFFVHKIGTCCLQK